MSKDSKRSTVRRLASFMLALAVTISFMPLLGSAAYAADGSEESQAGSDIWLVNDDGSETPLSEEEYQQLKAHSMSEPPEDIEVELDDVDAVEVPDWEVTDITAPDAPAESPGMDTSPDRPEMPESQLPEYYNVSAESSGNTVTVSGKIADEYTDVVAFGNLYIDSQYGTPVSEESYSTSEFTVTIDMSMYDIGYHTLWYQVYYVNSDGNLDYVWDSVTKLPTRITEKPNYKGVFDVYSKYFNFYPFDFGSNMSYPSGCALYMEYSSNGGKTWKRTGAMKANAIELYIQQGYKISGLKSNKTYKTRLVYGGYITYSSNYGGDDKSYFFKGPAFQTTTIKTGRKSKPSVRSITAKAVNVKYHKVRHSGGYYWSGNVLLYQNPWTEKFYTCNVKVTVRLKKKPGTKGIFLSCSNMTTDEKWLKGNKKTYTAKFTPYPNYYGKHPTKYTLKISVRSGQSKSWGGRSPAYTIKKKKIT